jgi:hypothetical protein
MRKLLVRSPFLAGLATIVMASALYWTGCGTEEATQPLESGRSQVPITLEMTNPRVQAVMAVQDRATPEIMEDPNVVGTATGLSADGEVVIRVLLRNPATTQLIAEEIDGVRVETEVVGTIRAMKGGGGGGGNHQGIQTPPIQLGTSGGWRYDLANGFCCGGTLGSLIQIGGNQYVLSNYHVLKADIVNGGNGRVATNGDPVIQPGLIDVGCNANNAQNVATLAGAASLPGSNVDAAIAQVIPGMVRTDGSILAVGTISSSTVNAAIGQAVKKSGRTTGLTRSSVSGLNATVSVAYENECAGGSAFTKTFNGQILVTNRKFLGGGDSGSLMVEDVTTNPRAVGLLFAGSNTIAVANPIGQVLSFFNASMVGN